MCGIAGIFSKGKSETELHRIVGGMSGQLRHRGPDAKGVWSSNAGVAFGHQRLAIIDLTVDGLQPMTSQSQRYTICFNGEIYNYQDLRARLVSEGGRLRGQSDTEVLLECIELFGLEWALEHSRGMFAFGLFDSEKQRMLLCRDRIGEKPLYYGMIGSDLVFASELKSFRKHPQFQFGVNRQALSAYTKYGYVPAPLCILEGFKKLNPASIVSGKSARGVFDCEPTYYWNLTASTDEEDGQSLEELLSHAVKMQMVSDVPVGCFLSGGIDSSLVAALMQSHCDAPIDTFTIGFSEPEYDESQHAAAVARHIGSNHTELVITAADVMDLVPRVGSIYDEPFGDSSCLPTTLLAELTRQSVTVCLSGDGGDELFFGYERYNWANKIETWRRRLPTGVKKSLVKVLDSRSEQQWDRLLGNFKNLLPFGVKNLGKKVHSLKDVFQSDSQEYLYDRIVSHWSDPEALVVGGENYSFVSGRFEEDRSFEDNMMLTDIRHYLSDDIMVKVDRATMSKSLESRAPLLDHRIVERAINMPIGEKMRGGKGKAPLREILYQYVPQEIIERPKQGFGVPLDSWLRGDLKGWAEELLDPQKLESQGYFHVAPIQACWNEHQSHSQNMGYYLWDILAFQQWLETWDV